MFKKETRKAILKRDNYACQLDRVFGISELTGVPCSPQFEIHHKTYKRAKDNQERVVDGITVCKRCHHYLLTNIIREKRYSKKSIKVKNINRVIPKINNQEVLNERLKAQAYKRISTCHAQRRDGKSVQ